METVRVYIKTAYSKKHSFNGGYEYEASSIDRKTGLLRTRFYYSRFRVTATHLRFACDKRATSVLYFVCLTTMNQMEFDVMPTSTCWCRMAVELFDYRID